jgi:hypothetical protein
VNEDVMDEVTSSTLQTYVIETTEVKENLEK